MLRFVGLLLVSLIAGRAAGQNGGNTVLMLAANELAHGGNSFIYASISTQRVQIQPGDHFEYDIFIAGHSAEISGGMDIQFDEGDAIRDTEITDQNGEYVHPKHVLNRARNHWYHRAFPMTKHIGRTTTLWSLVLEGDVPGPYAVFFGNIGIRHADGTRTAIYDGGPMPRPAMVNSLLGYSQKVVVRVVDRAKVHSQADMVQLVEQEVAAFDAASAIRQLQFEIQLVEDMIPHVPDGKTYQKHVDAARKIAMSLEAGAPFTAAGLEERLKASRTELARTRPMMKRFSAHLVGHGHIDPQWQWEWPEILDSCNKTFSQALKFMDEFPDFRYSQSSSALYKAVQIHYPEVFRQIQRRVKEGRWEITGGRVTEGDTNIISAEGQARQFLIGQRYFREHFGKTATVGWEPDTFGHSWSMPQILKMGGLNSYYFGRGGQAKPLFWWEGPDGTRMLSFDEISSGSWYDSNLDNKVLDEIPRWRRNTGLDTIMWVYGVGNHGGGPTREQLQTAQKWMRTPTYPDVKFSTAGAFFQEAHRNVPDTLPVLRGELDPRIAGVFTTHAELKRLNRDAENQTLTAEAAATIASLYGLPYPRDRFNVIWETLCFNHHHDTVPGAAVHDAYANNYLHLPILAAESRVIADASARHLAARVSHPKDAEYAVMAFNALGWKRGGTVAFPWPFTEDGRTWMAISPEGERTPVHIIRGYRPDNKTGEPMASFTARGIPGFGYSVYTLKPVPSDADAGTGVSLQSDGDRYVLDNGHIKVTVQRNTGLVTSLFDHARGEETVAEGGAANRLEIWHEDQGPNDAWVVNAYKGHESLDGPADVRVLDNSSGQAILEVKRTFRQSTITQWIELRAGSDLLELPMWVDWREEGTRNQPTPFLKLACDVAGTDLKARYEIPFATIERDKDGKEVAALKSAGLSGESGGLTILNDSRHGHAAEGNTLRLSLVRSPNRLDPVSDVRLHAIQAAILPHGKPYSTEEIRRGFEFNQPLLGIRVPPSTTGELPLQKSFVELRGDSVIPTVLKRSEDDPKGLLLRFYEAGGKTASVEVRLDPLFGANSGQWVNFVEDALPGELPGLPVSANLRPFEIRSVLFSAKSGR